MQVVMRKDSFDGYVELVKMEVFEAETITNRAKGGVAK